MDLHLIPGYFGEASSRLFARLEQSGTTPGTSEIEAILDEGAPPLITSVTEWLLATPEGESRRARARIPVGAGKRVPLEIEAHGAPAGRILVGQSAPPVEPAIHGVTTKDVEIAFLGHCCAALSNEAQGAVLIGHDLGPVGAGMGRGTIAEQVRRLIEILGERAEVIVATRDSADALGEIPGWLRHSLADLIKFRRF